MRTSLALLLAVGVASATETVSFRLPDPCCGRAHSIPDFGSRYLLLVYQGIP